MLCCLRKMNDHVSVSIIIIVIFFASVYRVKGMKVLYAQGNFRKVPGETGNRTGHLQAEYINNNTSCLFYNEHSFNFHNKTITWNELTHYVLIMYLSLQRWMSDSSAVKAQIIQLNIFCLKSKFMF